jgi:N-hydroxyarylamine O-acetyltransferase
MAARTGDGWRKTLNNGSFALHRMGADSERREISDVDELIDVLQQAFGLRVPDQPHVRQSLARMLVPV